MMAYRLLFLTIVFLPPATHLPRSRHPHSPYRPQSPPRTAAAHRVLSPAGDQVRIGAPAQTDPTVAFEPPSQPPFRGCCDDHLSPPGERRWTAGHDCESLVWNNMRRHFTRMTSMPRC